MTKLSFTVTKLDIVEDVMSRIICVQLLYGKEGEFNLEPVDTKTMNPSMQVEMKDTLENIYVLINERNRNSIEPYGMGEMAVHLFLPADPESFSDIDIMNENGDSVGTVTLKAEAIKPPAQEKPPMLAQMSMNTIDKLLGSSAAFAPSNLTRMASQAGKLFASSSGNDHDHKPERSVEKIDEEKDEDDGGDGGSEEVDESRNLFADSEEEDNTSGQIKFDVQSYTCHRIQEIVHTFQLILVDGTKETVLESSNCVIKDDAIVISCKTLAEFPNDQCILKLKLCEKSTETKDIVAQIPITAFLVNVGLHTYTVPDENENGYFTLSANRISSGDVEDIEPVKLLLSRLAAKSDEIKSKIASLKAAATPEKSPEIENTAKTPEKTSAPESHANQPIDLPTPPAIHPSPSVSSIPDSHAELKQQPSNPAPVLHPRIEEQPKKQEEQAIVKETSVGLFPPAFAPSKVAVYPQEEAKKEPPAFISKMASMAAAAKMTENSAAQPKPESIAPKPVYVKPSGVFPPPMKTKSIVEPEFVHDTKRPIPPVFKIEPNDKEEFEGPFGEGVEKYDTTDLDRQIRIALEADTNLRFEQKGFHEKAAPEANGVYSGTWIKNKKHGWGSYKWTDGREYRGQWVNDQMEGWGTYVWGGPRGANLETCDPRWAATRQSSTGVYEEGRYEGQWKMGQMHGYGTYTWSDGRSYDGYWRADFMHGKGKFRLADGSAIYGYFQKDRLNGKGTKYWDDGSKYVGDWKDGMAHGHGIQTWCDGKTIYEGAWEFDQMSGYGVMQWYIKETDEYDVYEGMWKDGLRHGKGKQTQPGGMVFEGEWASDCPARGFYTAPSKDKFEY